MAPVNITGLRYEPRQIAKLRSKVRRHFIERSGNISGGEITRLAGADLRLLFELYDAAFLGGYFTREFSGTVTFSLSTRMSRSAGKVIYPRNLAALPPERESYELRLGVDFFFDFYRLNREKKVNGILTRDPLEALQLVFEHELCHLIELHLFKRTSCRQKRFRDIAGNLFGHSESYHRLPTAAEIAAEHYRLLPGDRVCFTHEGKTLEGVISRINKRATVMVLDPRGSYRDQRGKRYQKWYVPLALLHKRDD